MTQTAPTFQLPLFEPASIDGENPEYCRRQLITYLGNKRQLLEPIGRAVAQVQIALDKRKLRLFDGFAGSGVVSRLFKSRASSLVVNDLESYARVAANCHLTNRSDVDYSELERLVRDINRSVDADEPSETGLIENLYAPKDDDSIRPGERVFYTRDNARRLDQYRQIVGQHDKRFHDLLLGPLLALASAHANTAGVFKGFYKDKATGIGKFGGSGADALERIKGQIRLQPPILSNYDTSVDVYQMDTNKLVSDVGDFDLAYFDPPYNQHPYGSNYFMLNLLVDYHTPNEISSVSGIPTGWNRSLYNQKRHALDRLADAITRVDARYVLLSFNDEGFIAPSELRVLLGEIGTVDEVKLKHNTFRGSRNLSARPSHVTEHLFLVRK